NYAAAIGQVLDKLGLAQVDLIAEGLSTALAVVLAKAQPGRIGTLVLDGVVPAGADLRTEMRINYCPDLRPTREGLHLHKAFHMLRDQEVQWPWYDGSAAAIRKIDPRLSGERLHIRLVDTLKQFDRYAEPIVAAIDVDLPALLPTLAAKTIVCTAPDDARYAPAHAAATMIKGARTAEVPRPTAERAAAILALLD
ncbi:MAG: alpha/beta hydrolase, partial [Rhodospirillaceae bacterium]|nr:alpha/beta hydrolase [Rhodospirillaceae bacterium]